MNEKKETSNRMRRECVCDTIDLHGYRKADAIARLTSFIERLATQHETKGDVWVCVITGSGAHSQDGPVLRTAVKELLEKRKMTFFLNKGGGTFTVNANSGFELYAPDPPSDTKVVVIESTDPLRRKKPTNSTGRWPMARDTTGSGGYSPTPAEIAANDAQFEASRRSHEEETRLAGKERKHLEKALSLSLRLARDEEEKEASMMKQALHLSKMGDSIHRQQDDEEDDDFRRALEQSRLEY